MALIAIIGTGYVGLTTGACFAHIGHEVVCVDIDEAKIALLNEGRIPIHEDGLENIVREQLETGRLRFVTDTASAVGDREFIYLCVPTPQGPDGSADMSYIDLAARQIAPHLTRGAVVVNKSTVPVGSTRLVEQALARSDIGVVSNPEFLREGSAVDDFMNPDRVVIGADDQSAATRVASLYLGVRAPIMITDAASAETRMRVPPRTCMVSNRRELDTPQNRMGSQGERSVSLRVARLELAPGRRPGAPFSRLVAPP